MNVCNFLLISFHLLNFININENEFSSFNNKEILKTKIVSDFANNNFLVEDMENSYAIYYLNDDNKIFIEGSNEVNSPYFKIDSDCYYLGPGNYFKYDCSKYFNLINGDEFKVDGKKYEFKPFNIENEISTIANYNDYFIKNSDYIRLMKKVPENEIGDCGIEALGILMSYYDSCIDDRFLDGYAFDGFQMYSGSKTPTISDYSSISCINTKFRDYFRETYGEYNKLVSTVAGGFPMADLELYNTMNNYLKNRSGVSNDYYFDHQTVMNLNIVNKVYDYITMDVPVVLVLANYTDELGYHSFTWHDVVAYGIHNNNLVVHIGYQNRTAVELSTIGLYGFYTMKPLKSHQYHSKNMKFIRSGVTKYLCGCGYES